MLDSLIAAQQEPTALDKLMQLYQSETLAEDIGEDSRRQLANKVMRDFEEDKDSLQDRLAMMDKAIEIVNLVKTPRHKPFMNCSNIKYPMVTTACINFASRAQFETTKNGEPLHYKSYGNDPTGFYERVGKRKKAYMNHQLMEEMPWWMDEKENIFYTSSIVGSVFTKVYYDSITKKKVIRNLKYDRLIVNNSVDSLESAPRISEIFYLTPTKLKQLIRSGSFRQVDLSKIRLDEEDSKAIQHELIEHHTWADLDDDGTDEPWIIIIHKASKEILRISPGFMPDKIDYNQEKDMIVCIEKEKVYVHYRFLPDPAGGLYGIAYGTLLADNNEAVNSIFNQLIDSGTLANYQGGLIGGDLRIRKKKMEGQLGEWFVVDSDGMSLKEGIVPFQYKEPSTVLFQLLSFLIESVNKMTSVTDALTGTANTTDTSPNVLSMLIQQGLKVYGAITRRLFRALGEEAKILDRLNYLYPDIENYLKVTSPSQEELKEMIDPENKTIVDLSPGIVKIVPVIDITQSTEAERLAKNQVLLQSASQLAALQPGSINIKAVARRLWTDIEIARVEELLIPDPPPNAPNFQLIKVQSDLDQRAKEQEFKDRELKIKEREQIINTVERGIKMKEITARSVKLLAEAGSMEKTHNLNVYKAELERLGLMLDAEVKSSKNELNGQQGSIPGENSFPNADMVKQEAMRRGWMQEGDNSPSSKKKNLPPKELVEKSARARGYL